MSQELINQFITKLETIYSWRKIELESIEIALKILEDEDDISDKSFLLRGIIALIYAHWEGAIKDIFLEFNDLINSLLKENSVALTKDSIFILELLLNHHKEDSNMKKIICDAHVLNKLLKSETIELNIYKIHIVNSIDIYENSKNKDKLKIITNFLDKEMQSLHIVKNVVNTNSNLGFDELKNILNKFDIIISGDIQIQQHRLIQLLKNRNDIAHGDNNFFHNHDNTYKIKKNIKNTRETLKNIVNLIEDIREKVIDKANHIKD